MNFLNFIFGILCLTSIDVVLGFLLYLLYKFLDLKYFSVSEVSILRQENEYLKNENKKINGTSTSFWSE